ncbi:MAG: hypothetical protein H0U54_18510 [Acidobacteria bacterium]|nr:hypothetical protein [Acidobacteriota bacterium]
MKEEKAEDGKRLVCSAYCLLLSAFSLFFISHLSTLILAFHVGCSRINEKP